VEVADRPAGSVVTVSGEVDTVTSPQLAELLQPLLMASPLVEIDMAGVTFINTAGVRVLLGARQTAVSFRILNPSHQVRRVLEVCEIAEYLGVEAPPGLD
jgi:anti-sigma B factor antagonist/stage II sporulation protein AA (anti-sigma F factor antagonist)